VADAVIDVGVIEADGMMAHARLPRPGITDTDIFPLKYFRSAGLVDSNCFGHEFLVDYW
jgi:hypothetical protein